MRRPSGFSLIELVITLVIAAIITAMAIPYFADQGTTKAAWFHEQVKAGVRFAQRQAIAQRRCVFVTVTANQLDLFYGDATCAVTGTQVLEPATGAVYRVVAPTPGMITPPAPATFSFNGLGQPSGAVAFTTGGGTLTVQAETGYVQ
jgi:MSHA pilin protein MshC